MSMGRPPIPITLSEGERGIRVHDPLSDAAPRPGAAGPDILACVAGEPQVEIAKRLGLSKMTVSKWRHRFHHQGTAGLYDQQRPGRPRTHDDERVAEVSNTA